MESEKGLSMLLVEDVCSSELFRVLDTDNMAIVCFEPQFSVGKFFY